MTTVANFYFKLDRVVIYAVYYCIGPQTEMLDNGSNTSSDAVFVCVCVCVCVGL